MNSFKKLPAELKNKIDELAEKKRFPHSILISGGTDAQRKDAALYIVSVLECNGSISPCGKCAGCSKVLGNVHPDVFYASASGKSDTVKLDEIKKIKEDSSILPNEGRAKVYIFPDGSKIRNDGQNSLLKIMEEPPEYVYIIICCDVRSVLLPTVLSRTFDFSLSSSAEVPVLSKKISAACVDIVEAVVKRNEFDLITAFSAFDKDRNALLTCINALSFIIRDAAVGGSNLSGMDDCALLLKKNISLEELVKIDMCLDEIIDAINRNANVNLLLSVTAAKIYKCLK